MSETAYMTAVYAAQPRTVIGPLTTTFTPPSACFTGILNCPGCNVLYYARQCVGADRSLNKLEDAITCWPTPSYGAPSPSQSPGGWWGYGFYSPGLHCPAGYTSACTATAGGHSDWDVQFSMEQGETAVGCCPTGFDCKYMTIRSHQHCSGTATSGDHLSVSQCFWNRNAFASFHVPAALISSSQLVSSKITYTMNAYEQWASMIEIRWQSSDRPDVSSLPVTASTTSAGSQISRESQESQESQESGGFDSSNRHQSGHTVVKSSPLSIGAGVAIGVSVLVAAICIMVAALWYFKRRKGRNQVSVDPGFKDDHFALSLGPQHRVWHEVEGWQATELEAVPSPKEMASYRMSTFR